MNDTKMITIQKNIWCILILLILFFCLLGIWLRYTSATAPFITIHARNIKFHIWPLIPTLLFVGGLLTFTFLFGIQLSRIFAKIKKNHEKIKKEQLLNDHIKILEQLEEKSLR